MTGGRVLYKGNDLTRASPDALSALRGREIAIIVQNPASALSPMTRIGDQLANAYRAHRPADRRTAKERAIEGLRQIGIPDPDRRARAYPHELSLGMAQRVLIAMALLHEPKLLIADEPTSGLDATIQAEILDLLMALVRERGTALWLITHDLGVVAHYCKRAAVMFGGTVVETGPVASLFENPAHPYTIGLVDARLTGERNRARFKVAGPPPDLTAVARGCGFAYRCPWAEERCRREPPSCLPIATDHEVRCWVAQEKRGGIDRPARIRVPDGMPAAAAAADLEPLVAISGLVKYFLTAARATVRAVDGVDLVIGSGQAVGLVGESGSGKSTLARCLLRITEVSAGQILFEGDDITRLRDSGLRNLRKRMQMVFQDPLGSLDPRQTVESIIDEPLRLLTTLSPKQRRARIHELIESVRLSAIHLSRHPHQLSGGQQQRVGIARALATNPRLCVLDEPTSAVDWPIRAELLELLDQLRREMSFSFLFISHDLGAVRYICDRVAVMYLGRIVEEAPTRALFAAPEHPYSRALLSSMLEPSLDTSTVRVELHGEPGSPISPPSGCRLHPRCPIALPACAHRPQELAAIASGHTVACMRVTNSKYVERPPSRFEEAANVGRH
jgi:peptide/nickel transport system ATP-binding protein